MQIWLIKNPGNRVTFSLPNNAKPLTIRPGIFPQKFFLKNKKHHCGRENNHNGTVSVPVHRCIKPQHCIEVVWRLYKIRWWQKKRLLIQMRSQTSQLRREKLRRIPRSDNLLMSILTFLLKGLGADRERTLHNRFHRITLFWFSHFRDLWRLNDIN